MSTPGRRCALVLPLLSAVAGCPERSLQAVIPVPTGETSGRFAVAAGRKLDLLFVIDDSDSMAREQEQLAIHARRMIEVLERLPAGRPDLHIGVVSTDVGGCGRSAVPGGVLRNEPNPSDADDLEGCTGPRDRYLIDTIDPATGERSQNYDGELGRAFACIATLGTGGCGFEQPLEAIRLALSPDTIENDGFLRDDALLAIVLLTDEDDCSASDPRLFEMPGVVDGVDIGPRTGHRCFAHGVRCDQPDRWALGPRTGCEPDEDSALVTPIADFVADLRAVRGDDQLVVAGIMGAPGVTVGVDDRGQTAVEPTCRLSSSGTSTGEETAYPPVRTDAFLAAFPDPVRTSICAEDLAPAIEQIAENILGRVWGRCIPGEVADVSPADGLQLECAVTEVIAPTSAAPRRRPVGACGTAAADRPCWQAVASPALCVAEPSQLEIRVDYPAGAEPDADTAIEFDCRSR
jgi:hypothetical protein